MIVDRAESFVSYWESIRGRTLRVADCIPPERIDWRYAEGKFSFADLLRHLGAIERWMFAENVQGKPSRYPGHGPELADGAEAVRRYLDRMHSESVAIFAALSDEQLRAKVETPAGIPITAWKWLRAMVEHEVHHRGQIYAWLGILEIPAPPLYGLTSEEVLERSNPLAIPSPLAIPNPLVIPSEVEGSVHSARGARSGRDDKEGATPSE